MGLETATICEQSLRGAEAVGDKGSLARIARSSDIKEKFAKTTTYRCEKRVASCNGCCWRYDGCSMNIVHVVHIMILQLLQGI